MRCELCYKNHQDTVVTDPDFGRQYSVCLACANKTGQLSDTDYMDSMEALLAKYGA